MILEVIEVPSTGHPRNSHKTKRLIRYKCDTCCVIFEKKFQTKYLTDRKTHFCSRKCSYEAKKVNGAIHATILRDNKKWAQTISATMVKKYGVDNISKRSETKEKKAQTFLERYGVTSPLKSEFFKEKSRQTCIEKYGVDNAMKSSQIKEKVKQTCIERYGVENYSQTYEFQQRNIRSTHQTGHITTHHGKFFYRSSYEKRFITCCDVFGYIDDVKQNIRIPYVFNDKFHYYFADFSIVLAGGQKILVEVKPASLLNDPMNVAKFSAAMEFAKKNNMYFVVVSETALSALENMTDLDEAALCLFANHCSFFVKPPQMQNTTLS